MGQERLEADTRKYFLPLSVSKLSSEVETRRLEQSLLKELLFILWKLSFVELNICMLLRLRSYRCKTNTLVEFTSQYPQCNRYSYHKSRLLEIKLHWQLALNLCLSLSEAFEWPDSLAGYLWICWIWTYLSGCLSFWWMVKQAIKEVELREC